METMSRVAIVTGAARGIGRAIALTLAQKGIIPVIADIDAAGAQRVVEEIAKMGITTESYKVDVSSVEQITQMVDDVAQRFGHVDILVNNAGILSAARPEELDEADWDRVMNVNAKSVMFATQQVLRYMKKQGWGRIVNIASVAGRMGGYSAGCAYAASKAAVIGITMNVARKVAKDNITVNAVAPGTVDSDILKGFTPEDIVNLEASIPVGRLGKPENVADAVAFLASDAASFITGAVIDVNGGMFMG